MTKPLTELHRAKRGVALLVTCLVQTMNEKDPTFQDRFLARLQEAYYEVRDNWEGGSTSDELELMSWTQEYLTGFSRVSGEGEPFLSDYQPK